MSLEGTRLGKYELHAEIGRGGMGTVYRGFDPALGRPIAVKVLASHLAQEKEFVARFLREARAAARLKHSHIVTIHDVGEQDNRYFFVMEFLEGQSLSQILRQRGRLSSYEALSILRQLADALDYAHQQGLIHRDVKPANVMVSDRGYVTLTDLGLVHAAAESRLTASGAMIGTPQYMSPEQAVGEEVGPPSDLYSLAIVAYEMLAGECPFDGASTPAVLYMQVHELPPPIIPNCPDLPPEVDQVLELALAKDPAWRYESGAAFVAALEKALKGHKAEPTVGPREVINLTKEIPKAADIPSELSLSPPQTSEVSQEHRQPPTKSLSRIWLAFGGLVALAAIIVVLALANGDKKAIPLPTETREPTATLNPSPTPLPTATLQPSVPPPPTETPRPSATATPTDTPSPTPTPTDTPSPTPTPTQGPGSTTIRQADDAVMMYVPGAAFDRGSTEREVDAALEQCADKRAGICQRSWYADESPQHPVALDSFWIDQTEVTNQQYNACVRADACQPSSLADNLVYNDADYPATGVDWENARAYCKWVGGDLPTEAEWEYAARGPMGHIYPWGDTFDGTRLNFCDAQCAETWNDTGFNDRFAKTAPVGSYPDGASWCGALDMAGNVWEWVYDWFGDYPSAAQVNPIGVSSGPYKVLRGGGWNSLQSDTRTASRWNFGPTPRGELVGFRCILPASSP